MSLDSVIKYGVPFRTDNEDGAKFLDELTEAARDYAKARDAARSDPTLTDVGRRERVAEIGKASLESVDELRKRTENVAARAQELRTRQRTYEPKQPTDPVGELRAQEARGLLRGLSDADRSQAIRRAVERGDEFTFAAVLGDPFKETRPLLNPELAERYRDEWLRVRDPKLAEAIDHVDELHSAMESAADSVRRGIESDAGLSPDLRTRIGA